MWTLAIRQVARQPLPRVIPEKMCIEVSYCYGGHKTTRLSYMDGPSTGSYDTVYVVVTAGDGLCHMSHLSRLRDGF